MRSTMPYTSYSRSKSPSEGAPPYVMSGTSLFVLLTYRAPTDREIERDSERARETKRERERERRGERERERKRT